MPHYVADSRKYKSAAYYIRGIPLFAFELIDEDKSIITCECGNNFEIQLSNMHLTHCHKCGCLWHVEKDDEKISLTQPKTNNGIIFSESQNYLERVDTEIRDNLQDFNQKEKERIGRSQSLKEQKVEKLLKSLKKSGLSLQEIKQVLREIK